MLSPRYLAGLGDELTDIYAQLELDILEDMARRIARLGKITEATRWQAAMLAENGALKRRVNSLIKKYDPQIKAEIKAVYNDALIKNARADNRIFYEATGRKVSEHSAQAMLAGIAKTHSDLSRLTMTTAYTTEQLFIQQANAAYMQVVSGAFDYDSAMKSAADNLAAAGISAVQYINGKPTRRSIEAAARMNILTGVNQTAAAVSMSNCEELGCDLVEVTAHIGARPEHEAWQGKIYSLSGNSEKYPPFSVCGYGEITGICGVNCRHSFYPYFEGEAQHYTADELDEMSAQKVEYNGEEMTRYEGEEKLRGIERNIRKYKRRAVVQDAAGVDNTAAREKIGEWQQKAADFTKQTGITRDRAREFIGTTDGAQPRAIYPKAPEVVTPPPAPAATAAPAPAPVVVTPAAATTAAPEVNSVKVTKNGFAPVFFKNKINTESTTELINYINSQPNASGKIKELFNHMKDAEMLNNGYANLTIRNSSGKHFLHSHYRDLELVINRLEKNDPHIIGKAGTNIHEIGHLFDTLGANTSVYDHASYKRMRQAIENARKYSAGEIPQEINKIFEKKKDRCKILTSKIYAEGNEKIRALNAKYKAGGLTYKDYSKEYNAIKRWIDTTRNLALDDEYNGVDSLMDIYDALSGGKYFNKNIVDCGHGVSYYHGNLEKQAAEIWANYTRLSITNPELVELLGRYEPELLAALDENADYILNSFMGA